MQKMSEVFYDNVSACRSMSRQRGLCIPVEDSQVDSSIQRPRQLRVMLAGSDSGSCATPSLNSRYYTESSYARRLSIDAQRSGLQASGYNPYVLIYLQRSEVGVR
jgi:hypothetical protein